MFTEYLAYRKNKPVKPIKKECVCVCEREKQTGRQRKQKSGLWVTSGRLSFGQGQEFMVRAWHGNTYPRVYVGVKVRWRDQHMAVF